MTTLQKAIKDRLAGDWALTQPQPGALGFQIFDRWLVYPGNFAKPTPGSTPEAFDQGQGGRLRRSIVVLAGGDVDSPSSQMRDVRRWDSYPRLYFFAEAHANGKQAIEDAKLRVEDLLVPWEVVITRGQRVSFRPADEVPLEDSEQFPGNVVCIVRWRATGTRRLAAA